MISGVPIKRNGWQTAILLALAFWLSMSVLLHAIIMPTMYTAGMMADPDFATAGYSLFSVINRIELICAALVLTGVLASWGGQPSPGLFRRNRFFLAIGLLAIVLVYTYALTPQMSSLGAQLNLFSPLAEVPQLMNQLHFEYWLLEVMKLVGVGVLLRQFYRQRGEPV
jgi:hypothetical protein